MEKAWSGIFYFCGRSFMELSNYKALDAYIKQRNAINAILKSIQLDYNVTQGT